jgi:hypothetical protein
MCGVGIVGARGLTWTSLSPSASGFVNVGVATYAARSDREEIAARKEVIVTGFTSNELIVREATSLEVNKMGMTQCRECKGAASSEAATCPHCGVANPGSPQSPVANKTPWYLKGMPGPVRAFLPISALLVLGTLILAVLAWWSPTPKEYLPWLYLCAAFWGVTPPLWFWFEYHYYILDPKVGNMSQLEKYKYGVQTGMAVWAGIAVSLAAYISSDHFKTSKPVEIQQPVQVQQVPGKQ